MNKVTITGRLTRDPELRKTTSDLSVCSFTVAVNGRTKDDKTSFINCTAWRGTADYIGQYMKKGNLVAVSGRLQQRDWEKDGERRTALDVIVEEFDNLTPRGDTAPAPTMEKVEEPDNDLPF